MKMVNGSNRPTIVGKTYGSPRIEVVDVAIERGFAASAESTIDNPNEETDNDFFD